MKNNLMFLIVRQVGYGFGSCNVSCVYVIEVKEPCHKATQFQFSYSVFKLFREEGQTN